MVANDIPKILSQKLTQALNNYRPVKYHDLIKINPSVKIQQVFCKWLASVKRNYRPVKYHNWRHAFNVCQTTFAMLTMGGLGQYFDDIERLALLVSCLCHDLDHRGRNNAFQAKLVDLHFTVIFTFYKLLFL